MPLVLVPGETHNVPIKREDEDENQYRQIEKGKEEEVHFIETSALWQPLQPFEAFR